MEPNLESAQHYYNPQRKRSFFYSRLFVVVSMLVLVVVLTINISVLYSEQRTSTTTQASNGQTQLPNLPQGCEYQSNGQGKNVKVVCASATPVQKPTSTPNAVAPLTVGLPKLPAQCRYLISEVGYEVKCTVAQPIPTVAVTTPIGCELTSNGPGSEALRCREGNNKPTPLPTLPKGCEYKAIGTNYFVSCVATLEEQTQY